MRRVLRRLVCLVLTGGAVATTSTRVEAQTDLPSNDALRVHLDHCFARYRNAAPQNRNRLFDGLDELVRLEADGIEFDGAKLDWNCRRKRRLTAAERRRAIDDLDTLLTQVLSVEPFGQTGRPAFSAEEARRLVDHGTLRIPWQPSLTEVSVEKTRSALQRYLTHLETAPPDAERLLALRRQLNLDTESLRLSGTNLTWEIGMGSELRNKLEEFLSKLPEDQRRSVEEVLSRARRHAHVRSRSPDSLQDIYISPSNNFGQELRSGVLPGGWKNFWQDGDYGEMQGLQGFRDALRDSFLRRTPGMTPSFREAFPLNGGLPKFSPPALEDQKAEESPPAENGKEPEQHPSLSSGSEKSGMPRRAIGKEATVKEPGKDEEKKATPEELAAQAVELTGYVKVLDQNREYLKTLIATAVGEFSEPRLRVPLLDDEDLQRLSIKVIGKFTTVDSSKFVFETSTPLMITSRSGPYAVSAHGPWQGAFAADIKRPLDGLQSGIPCLPAALTSGAAAGRVFLERTQLSNRLIDAGTTDPAAGRVLFGPLPSSLRRYIETTSSDVRAERTVRRGRTVEAISKFKLVSVEPWVAGGASDSYTLEGGKSPQLVIDAGGFSGGSVSALAFSPDGNMLAAGGEVVRIWDLNTGELTHTLRGQRGFGGAGACTDMTFTPDGRSLLVAVSGYRASLRVYDLAALPKIQYVIGGHNGHIDKVAISPDGRWLLTAGVDNVLHVWNWSTRRKARSFRFPRPLDHLSFPTSRPWALAVDVRGDYTTIDVSLPWHEKTLNVPPAIDSLHSLQEKELVPNRSGKVGEQFIRFVEQDNRWPFGGRPHPFALAIDLQHDMFVAGGIGKAKGDDRYWCGVWSSDRQQPLQVFRHRYYLTTCAASKDCRWIASADALGEISVWDAQTGKRQHCFVPQSAPIYSVAFDRTGKRLFFGQHPFEKGKGWRYNHYGLLTHQLDLTERTVRSISPQDPPEPVLQQSGRRLQLRQAPAGIPELSLSRWGQRESRLPFASASRRIPLCYTLLRGSRPGFADGVIVGGEGGDIVCFEPTKLLSRRSFVGHSDKVWCVHESHDGRYLASGSGDGTIRIWNLGGFRDWGDLAAYADGDGRVYHIVPGTPTEKAGIKPGDRVLEIGGQTLGSLVENLAASGEWPFRAGERVAVSLSPPQSTDREQSHSDAGDAAQQPSGSGSEIKLDGSDIKVELSNMGDIGEPLLSVFVSADGREWVIWTPEGYYDASPQGDRFIGWHINQGCFEAAEFYRAEQFRKRFCRPDVIAEVLRLGNIDTAVEAANARRSRPPQNVSSRQRVAECRPPAIRIEEPSNAMITGESEIVVKADVRSRSEEPLRNARVLVNGKAFAVKGVVIEPNKGLGKEELSKQHWRIAQKVPLVAGENELSVIASTDTAEGTSNPVVVTYRESVAPTDKPRLLVGAVGVSHYEQDQFTLQYADRDAEQFAAVWPSQEGGLYREVQVRVITNSRATRTDVLDLIDWLVKSARSGDVAILFLSGHGITDKNLNYYFAPYDMHAERLRSTAVSWAEIEHAILDLRSNRFLLFVDTCHGGGATGGSNRAIDPMRELSKQGVGAIVFGGCTPQAQSLEEPTWEHGAFTKALLDTFTDRESDRDDPRDGKLSINDLVHNLDTRVQDLTDGRQVPVVGMPPTITNFDVFRFPR